MTQHNTIKLFEAKKVRTIWDDKDEKLHGYYPLPFRKFIKIKAAPAAIRQCVL